MKSTLLILVTVFFSQLSFAGIAPKYSGEFQFDPKGGHSGAITGTLTLASSDEAQFSEVVLVPSAPVFGKKELRSDTLLTHYIVDGSPDRLAAIMSLKGTPHKWFFVWLLTSEDGGITYQATFYKVAGNVEDILKEVAKAELLPIETWKPVGEGVVKKDEAQD
jgi:hypothetical protein